VSGRGKEVWAGWQDGWWVGTLKATAKIRRRDSRRVSDGKGQLQGKNN